MIKEIKQKDVDSCLGLLSNNNYDNLKTRMLAFLQAPDTHAFGYFKGNEILGFIFFSSNSFDMIIHFLIVNPFDETVIKNLVSKARECANLVGAKGIYINLHNLDENILKQLEIYEQYRLE